MKSLKKISFILSLVGIFCLNSVNFVWAEENNTTTSSSNPTDIVAQKYSQFAKSKGFDSLTSALESIENNNKTEKELTQEQAEDDETDPFLMDAIQTVVETGQASTSFIQRKFKVGYARAGRIIDQMEERGVISGYQGSKPREVLMTLEKLNELKMGSSTTTE